MNLATITSTHLHIIRGIHALAWVINRLVVGGYLLPAPPNDSAAHFVATRVHTHRIRYLYPLLLQIFRTSRMPRLKTSTFVVAALLAVAGTYADPFQQRGFDEVFQQCQYKFVYASFLFPANYFRRYQAPTTKTNPSD